MTSIVNPTPESASSPPLPTLRPPPRPQRLLWGLIIGGVAAFVAIAADVLLHGRLWQWDRALAVSNKNLWNNTALWTCAAITQPGEVTWIAFFALLLSLFLIKKKRTRELWILLLALLGPALLIPALKALFALPRPSVTSYFALTSGYTFPSGHTAGATVLFAIAAYLLGRTARPLVRWLLAAGAALGSLAVGASLIYIGAHYVTDVLAALAFCVTWLATCVLLARRMLK